MTDGTGTVKLDIIAAAMEKMGYAAVGVAGNDAVLGDAFYEKMAAHKIAVVDTSPVANKAAVPFLLKNVGGVKVGILSFGTKPPGVTVDDIGLRKTRFLALKEAREKSDVLILLDQGAVANRDWIDRNGPRVGAPDIVVSGIRGNISYSEEVVARTHILPALPQAKELAVVDVELTPNVEPKVEFKRVMLDEKVAEDPDLLKQINDAMAAAGISPNGPQIPPGQVAVDFKPTYSVKLCKACHLKQYEDWAQTKHAKALQTLVDQTKTTADCLPCHSEAYRVAKQYARPENGLGGVECATCHAESLPHGMERKEMAVHTKVQPAVCLECHTKDRSPTYDEKTYFPKIAHASVAGSATASLPPAGH